MTGPIGRKAAFGQFLHLQEYIACKGSIRAAIASVVKDEFRNGVGKESKLKLT